MVSTIVLGVIVTSLVQWLKNKYQTTKGGTLFIVAVLSFVFAIGAMLLTHFQLMETFMKIVASATVIYAFIVQHFEGE